MDNCKLCILIRDNPGVNSLMGNAGLNNTSNQIMVAPFK